MLKNVTFYLIAFSVLAACEPGLDAPKKPNSPDVKVEEVVIEEVPEAKWVEPEEWVPYRASNFVAGSGSDIPLILGGGSFFVSFDRCPYDDEGYTEENDPLAGIRCDYAYFAERTSDGLIFTGVLESTGTILSAPGEVASNNSGGIKLKLWGAGFQVTSEGIVLDGSDNEIGVIGLGLQPGAED